MQITPKLERRTLQVRRPCPSLRTSGTPRWWLLQSPARLQVDMCCAIAILVYSILYVKDDGSSISTGHECTRAGISRILHTSSSTRLHPLIPCQTGSASGVCLFVVACMRAIEHLIVVLPAQELPLDHNYCVSRKIQPYYLDKILPTFLETASLHCQVSGGIKYFTLKQPSSNQSLSVSLLPTRP